MIFQLFLKHSFLPLSVASHLCNTLALLATISPQREDKALKVEKNFLKAAEPAIKLFNKAVTPFQESTLVSEVQRSEGPKVPTVSETTIGRIESELYAQDAEDVDQIANTKNVRSMLPSSSENLKVNKNKLTRKHVDMVAMAVCGIIWMSVTIGFTSAIMS